MYPISKPVRRGQPWRWSVRGGASTDDGLRDASRACDPLRPLALRILGALAATGTREIVDLCSGNGGAGLWLHRHLAVHYHRDVAVLLTDLQPNALAWQRALETSAGWVSSVLTPVDALDLPEAVRARRALRTLFSTLHHFNRDQLRSLFQAAVDDGAPIAAFEMTRCRRSQLARQPRLIPLALFGGVLAYPLRSSRLALTLGLPLLPALLVWEGFASRGRGHSLQALQEITGSLEGRPYRWSVGEDPLFGGSLALGHVLGTPA
ncbi:MAG: hypothetical protein MJE66_13995 [Proteobacteria bacterium]|nr:hypothetical protein [Pseudomonadota bacterium]